MLTPRELLKAAVSHGASDLHLAVLRPPTMRINGRLSNLGTDALTPDDINSFINEITPEKHQRLLRDRGGSDFSFQLDASTIFRVSIFKQRGLPSAVLRLIPSAKKSLAEIGLGPAVRDLLFRQRGLILITGPTGSGKSTTLAAMIDVINTERECNIITIEDPIEYRHEHKRSIIVQREVGEDVPSFEEALVRALRQDPDVILVGEMRNLETIEAAVRAAETGHLVLSTLHTTGAARTVDRIVDVFPSSSRDEIRTQLAGTLQCVISQQLIPRINGGRVAAFEIMFNTPSIAAYIRENKTYRITSDLQTGAKLGMCTMDASLIDLYLRKEISHQEMMLHCYDPALINKLLADVALSAQKQR